MTHPDKNTKSTPVQWRWHAILWALALTLAGCGQLRDRVFPGAPDVTEDWRALIADIRELEYRIGFLRTSNFADVTRERESFPFCGQAPRFVLPWSYQDPAIRWRDTGDEAECREGAGSDDVWYGAVEAIGESSTPVTPAMLEGKLDRFIYLVIHEDCHDQFDLPFGIEEPLCNVITYRAMERFAKEKFRWYSSTGRAIRNYATEQSKLSHLTIEHYRRIAALYTRHARGELSAEETQRQREAHYAAATRELKWTDGTMNNVSLANHMTYSRHYPYLEEVLRALGGDLARYVEFFRRVDRAKPQVDAFLKRHGIASAESVEFFAAYEQAVIDVATKMLAAEKR